MTLVLKLNLDMAKMYLHVKNEASTSRHSKLRARTAEHTNKQTNKLDLDPMTLVLKLNLDMAKMYLYAKNEASTLRHSKVRAQRARHTNKQTNRQTLTP